MANEEHTQLKIGFGGSCHWCTEAIFRSIRGVNAVEQGWINSESTNSEFSEAVVVYFDSKLIYTETLIAIHLHTHSCTANHTMRGKYRSAVYTFSAQQQKVAVRAIESLQTDFNAPIITVVIPFQNFKLNSENYLDYYYKNPSKPFCQNIVSPKLKLLLARFGNHIASGKKQHLQQL